MNLAFYTGVSGLLTYQSEMDNHAHNMANVSTAGYKPTKMAFKDILYTEMDVNKETPPMMGHGVQSTGLDLNMDQGMMLPTNSPLDFTLLSEGFFAVERKDGMIEYTRNGAFDISVEGNKSYLVSDNGGYVLDAKGKHIEIPKKTENTNVPNLSDISSKLGVYNFPNRYGLQQTESSCFRETELSGAAKAATDSKSYQIRSGTLEQSGVNLADQMVQVMMTQKAYQFNSRIVQTADQIEETINGLR